jgi:polysulfide reductase chain C
MRGVNYGYYDVFHLLVFNWTNILCFFFSGLAAGSFLLSFWAGYEREKLRSLAKTSAVVTPISLVIGLALLILDLGRPFQFWRVLTTFQPTSIVSWASWVLVLFFIVTTLYAFLWFTDKGASAKTLGWLGLMVTIKASKNAAFHTLVSTLLLVGVLAMRYIVVMGGQVNL